MRALGARDSDFDFNLLQAELQSLKDRLFAQHDQAADAIALDEAIVAASARNAEKTESRLKRISRSVLDAAREIGLELAAAVIAKAMGI
jgi:hypothetical protein